MAEQTQWLHVFIDVAREVSVESLPSGPRCLGWPVGEQWPGTRSTAASPHQTA